MPKDRISGGYILLSRRLIESEIWDKPPMYLKVWIYILTKARHKATDRYSRGEMLISIPELQEACSHKVGYRVEKPKKHEIDNILRWLRRASEGQHGYDNEEHTSTPMITTTKTTRGMVVKVHNYNVYQNPKNYEYDSAYDNGYDNATTTNTTMLRQGSDTIHKNVKNVEEGKNVKNEEQLTSVRDEYEKLIMPITANDYENINAWLGIFKSSDVIIKAINIASDSGNRRMNYINGILKNWRATGLDTIEKIEADQEQRKNRMNKNKNIAGTPTDLSSQKEKELTEKLGF